MILLEKSSHRYDEQAKKIVADVLSKKHEIPAEKFSSMTKEQIAAWMRKKLEKDDEEYHSKHNGQWYFNGTRPFPDTLEVEEANRKGYSAKALRWKARYRQMEYDGNPDGYGPAYYDTTGKFGCVKFEPGFKMTEDLVKWVLQNFHGRFFTPD